LSHSVVNLIFDCGEALSPVSHTEFFLRLPLCVTPRSLFSLLFSREEYAPFPEHQVRLTPFWVLSTHAHRAVFPESHIHPLVSFSLPFSRFIAVWPYHKFDERRTPQAREYSPLPPQNTFDFARTSRGGPGAHTGCALSRLTPDRLRTRPPQVKKTTAAACQTHGFHLIV